MPGNLQVVGASDSRILREIDVFDVDFRREIRVTVQHRLRLVELRCPIDIGDRRIALQVFDDLLSLLR